jgi:hypothetical protein
MAPPRAPRARRRPRPGSLERPVNARSYRGTWLLAGLPLLILAFSLKPLPAPLEAPLGFVPGFDRAAALTNAEALAQQDPDRRPGTDGARRAAAFVTAQLRSSGYKVTADRFDATIAGLGTRQLVNLAAEAPGRTRDAIVVLAHRDDVGAGGLDDNASGTAALLELARAYGVQPGAQERAPNRTFVFVSTDGGAYGGIGAERFARQSLGHRPFLAVVNLDAIGARKPLRAILASDNASSPDPILVSSASRAAQAPLAHASTFHQLLDLALPFSLYEQAPFTARGTPAITLTTSGDRPTDRAAPSPPLDGASLGAVGRAASRLLSALDNAGPTSTSTRTYVLMGARRVPGWAIQLLLLAALLPALVAIVDLFARCRRRGIPLRPAIRSLRTRAGFWLAALVTFELFVWLGLFPYGAARPVSLETQAAQSWPLAALALLGIAVGWGWLAARERLMPRRAITAEEELAGHTGALLGLALVAILLVALDRYALVLVLPSLHAWIWLPQLRAKPRYVRVLVFLAGLAGPAWVLHAFATRLALGLDTPWYLMELAVVHQIPLPYLIAFGGWLAVAGQLLTLTAGRYAPYPRADELPPRGPVRESVRRLVLAGRAVHAATPAPRRRAAGE